MQPIDFPVIRVDSIDRTITVAYTIGAQLLMKRRGIDPKALTEACDPKNPDAVQNILIVFSAMVADNFIDSSNPYIYDLNHAPTADFWAAKIHPLQFPAIEAAIAEAMGKVTEARKLRLAPPPTTEAQAAS